MHVATVDSITRRKSGGRLARPEGFEPPTVGSEVRCSVRAELRARAPPPGDAILCGVSGGIRTHDSQIHSLELYRLSYTHHAEKSPAFLARLADPAERPVLEAYAREKVAQLGSWNSVTRRRSARRTRTTRSRCRRRETKGDPPP